MNKKIVVAAAAGFILLFALSLPAEAQGWRFSVGVNYGYGSAYFTYGRPWYGPAYYPYPYRYTYYPAYAPYGPYVPYGPYPPVTVMRARYPARVYYSYPPGHARAGRAYGHYAPRRYVRGVMVPVYP